MAYYPGQKVRYKQPRKITPAKVGLLVGVLAAIYFGLVFVPPYYSYYRATSIMKDEGSKAYSLRHQKEGWVELENKIHRRVRNRLLDILKIPSEQLTVIVKKMPKSIKIHAEWTVYARWPMVSKESKLHFKETVNTDLR
ncbi:MAG: hypothetical protein ABI333_15985 [bacterium]